MIKIHPNIIIGSLSDLGQILGSVNYIVNCSTNLNNIISHPNYLNLNINQFTFESLQTLNSVYDFVFSKLVLEQNVFLLCETGIDKSLIVGLFILMKMHNLNFNSVYHNVANSNKINPYECYSGLKIYEPHIIAFGSGEKMDIS
jgi:hypothetical protein